MSDIGSQPIKLLDALNLKDSKNIWGIKLIFCFYWSYKTYHAILGYDPKILSANQFAGYFTFDLFDLLILLTGVHCYIILNWHVIKEEIAFDHYLYEKYNFCFQYMYSVNLPGIRAYFRKAGHACGMNKKGHILVNFGKFKDEAPLSRMQI